MAADGQARHFDPGDGHRPRVWGGTAYLSTVYERPVVGDEAGVETLAMVGLVARMRRLLRSSYRLADAGEVLEASILNRAMMEYLFTLRGLQVEPEPHY